MTDEVPTDLLENPGTESSLSLHEQNLPTVVASVSTGGGSHPMARRAVSAASATTAPRKSASSHTPIDTTSSTKIKTDDNSISVSDHPPPQNNLAWEKPVWAKERTLKPSAVRPNADVGWQKPDWTVTPSLKESSSGHHVKTLGCDLQKPITKATDRTTTRTSNRDDINFEANPMLLLKASHVGGAVRLGQDLLVKSITHIPKDPLSDVNFEANPTFVLRQSSLGQAVQQGTSLSKPVTFCHKPDGMGVHFDANPSLLKPTNQGKLVKLHGNLQKPITAATDRSSASDHHGVHNMEANPVLLRPTEQGSLLRLGEKLERPITPLNNNNTATSTSTSAWTSLASESGERPLDEEAIFNLVTSQHGNVERVGGGDAPAWEDVTSKDASQSTSWDEPVVQSIIPDKAEGVAASEVVHIS
jgi:hypothetical protein